MIRENSERIVRTSWPRSGTSIPSIFSTARTYPTPLIMADVVQPVAERDRLVPGVRLRHLLEAAVHVSDLRLGARDPLPVQPRDQMDDPVRGRMGRPDRDRLRLEVAGLLLGMRRPVGHPEVFLREEPSLARRV